MQNRHSPPLLSLSHQTVEQASSVGIICQHSHSLQRLSSNMSTRRQPCTPLLWELHWLPAELHIKYKVCCLCFKVMTDSVLKYFLDHFRCSHHPAPFDLLLIPDYLKWTGITGNSMAPAVCVALDPRNELPYSARHWATLSPFKSNLNPYIFSFHETSLLKFCFTFVLSSCSQLLL